MDDGVSILQLAIVVDNAAQTPHCGAANRRSILTVTSVRRGIEVSASTLNSLSDPIKVVRLIG